MLIRRSVSSEVPDKELAGTSGDKVAVEQSDLSSLTAEGETGEGEVGDARRGVDETDGGVLSAGVGGGDGEDGSVLGDGESSP